VIEFEGIGPGPLAGKMLASYGAEVTVIRRPSGNAMRGMVAGGGADIIDGGKAAVAIDLKGPEGVAAALDLVASADALIEGNRPGVMERLGLGPDVCFARNPKLVYGRMTGWGQDGPLASAAGHDLNYVALSGLLSLAVRPGVAPLVPPTVLGDATGALGLCFGMVSALLEARTTGKGQVVDAAITDIVAMLGSLVHFLRANGALDTGRPSMFHDSPFYDSYECSDGKWVTVGALEPQFYAIFVEKIGLSAEMAAAQFDFARWPELKARVAEVFRGKTRDEWCALLEGTDVCFAPVLTIAEAAQHPHNVARGTFTVEGNAISAAAAPRFKRQNE
ncbi:MAG: CoA transferase, partial [Polyangiaceae bacterium]|nr:CoA transferase [Polyangiaceae bacterium]